MDNNDVRAYTDGLDSQNDTISVSSEQHGYREISKLKRITDQFGMGDQSNNRIESTSYR